MLSSQAVAGGSEIYRIQSDGYPRRIWSHAQDLVYALAFDAQGRLLAGTGNHGNLYRIDSDYSYTRLLNVEPTQITGLLRAPEGQLYAVTGNIGKVIAIGPELEPSGTFESDVLDAGGFSYWGRISKEPEAPAGNGVRNSLRQCRPRAEKLERVGSSESGPRGFPARALFAISRDAERKRRIVRRRGRVPDEERGSGGRAGGDHAAELSFPCSGRDIGDGCAKSDAHTAADLSHGASPAQSRRIPPIPALPR